MAKKKPKREKLPPKLEALVRNLELQKACKLVEEMARQIGRNCEIIFMNSDKGRNTGVQVSPLSWSGYVDGPDLYTALTQAHRESDGTR